jgi:hypothetical protein
MRRRGITRTHVGPSITGSGSSRIELRPNQSWNRRVQISNPASIQRIVPTLGSTVPGQQKLYLRFAHLIQI